ncbi:MAG: PBP1b-binding outer membrane lipoprotein LpoB [Bacteroidia bacterium]|jgi:PBP1b-binding outer membrane lipoprotein LpoB
MKRINSVLIIAIILIGCKEKEVVSQDEVSEKKETKFTFEKVLSNQNSKDACVLDW